MYFDADLLIDANEERVNFSLEFPKKTGQGKGEKTIGGNKL